MKSKMASLPPHTPSKKKTQQQKINTLAPSKFLSLQLDWNWRKFSKVERLSENLMVVKTSKICREKEADE